MAQNPLTQKPQQQPAQQKELPVMDEDGYAEQCGGDWKFGVELLEEFLQEKESHMASLQNVTDWKAAKGVAHSLKGVCLNLHATALSDVSRTLEFKAKELSEATTKDPAKIASFNADVVRLGVEFERLSRLMTVLERRAAEQD